MMLIFLERVCRGAVNVQLKNHVNRNEFKAVLTEKLLYGSYNLNFSVRERQNNHNSQSRQTMKLIFGEEVDRNVVNEQ